MPFLKVLTKHETGSLIIGHIINTCYSSNRQFRHYSSPKVSLSVFKDMIFKRTDTDLQKWFYEIRFLLNFKKSLLGYQLMREIGVTYKTARRILKQNRISIENKENSELCQTIIEIDEIKKIKR